MTSEHDKFPPDWFPDDVELVVMPKCRFCGDDAWFIGGSIPWCPKVVCMDKAREVLGMRNDD